MKGLNNSRAIFFRKSTLGGILNPDLLRLQNVLNSQHAFRVSFVLNLPVFPFNISDKDLSSLFPAPVTAFPCLPLSINVSTASCNILFSFLIMISGAWISISFFNLLFLFITRLYNHLSLKLQIYHLQVEP